jgi:DNA-binding MarR family transcriptional regulator
VSVPDDLPSPTTGYLVWRLSMKWRAAVDRAVASLGLTHAQYSLLASLYGLSRSGARPSQRQLSDSSGLEPMYVSKLARALEVGGLLARASSPTDPRAIQLTLTERGVTVVAAAIGRVAELQEELTAPLGGTGSDRSRELVRALRALLREPRGDDHMTQQALPVTGQQIGEAQRAMGALFNVLLTEVGISLETWVALAVLARSGGPMSRTGLRQELVDGFLADPATINPVLDALSASGLVRVAGSGDGAELALTPEGLATHARMRDGIARDTAKVCAGMDAADLATTRRVLEEVTVRARALLRN